MGDTLTFDVVQPRRRRERRADRSSHTARPVTFRIVGIVRRPLDLGGRGSAGGVVVPTPAFLDRYRDRDRHVLRSTCCGSGPSAGQEDVARVSWAARKIFGSSHFFSFTSLGVEGQAAEDAVDVTTVGLSLAAAVALLTVLIGIGIALSREVALGRRTAADAERTRDAAPTPRLRGGRDRRADRDSSARRSRTVGAVVASPIFPIGIAAKAEPDPGIRVDPVAIGLGGLAIVAAVLVIALVAGARTARAPGRSGCPRLPRWRRGVMEQSGLHAPAAVGVGFALDRGRQRHALPVRSSLFGAAFGGLVIVAVLVFSAGIDHLVNTPSTFGWTWDLVAYDNQAIPEGEGDCGPVTTRYTEVEGISDVASVCNGSVEVAGRPVTGWAFVPIRGRIGPAIVEGRAPRADDEVVLGADTLAAVHRSIGDHVRIAAAGGGRRMRIVGQVAFASMSDPQPLADGAGFTAPALDRLGANGGWNIVVRVAPGADRAASARQVAPPEGSGGEVTFAVPAEIDRVQQIDTLPVALAAFVAVVALVAVGLGLVTSLRRRRRDLALLKTLGFTRRSAPDRSRMAGQHRRRGGPARRDPVGSARRRFRLAPRGRRARRLVGPDLARARGPAA